MSTLIPLIYLATCLAIFPHAVSMWQTPVKRVKFYFLAFALMCFGTGRFLYLITPETLSAYEWIFSMAHLSLCFFSALYLWCAVDAHLARKKIAK